MRQKPKHVDVYGRPFKWNWRISRLRSERQYNGIRKRWNLLRSTMFTNKFYWTAYDSSGMPLKRPAGIKYVIGNKWYMPEPGDIKSLFYYDYSFTHVDYHSTMIGSRPFKPTRKESGKTFNQGKHYFKKSYL